MRVLVIPEVYRPGDLSSNGTVRDAASWVAQWLERDDHLHVYWLLPPRERADYEPGAVHADREQVTLIEAEPFADADEPWSMFTEGGYSREQLVALREAIFAEGAYVDVVVDGLRTGRFTLEKWLAAHTDHWAAQVDPFDVVADVHDLQVPYKYRWCDYRTPYQMYAELAGITFADGAWFHAGVDADAYRRYAPAVLRSDVVERCLEEATRCGSPLELSAFEERYADDPRTLHVAGSLWSKKHAGRVLEVAEALSEAFDVETVMTSMEPIPASYRERPFVEAHPEADRATYEAALRRGDIAVFASEYETMARTPFEQAASGQVLVLRDEPWIDDCVPEGYAFAGEPGELVDLATRAVRDWDRAVSESRRLVEHVRRVRSPERCGRRTYEDLRERVRAKRRRFEPDENAAVVEAALAELLETGADHRVHLDDLIARTAGYAADDRPVTAREDCALADVVYALRELGLRDAGNPGTPAFVPVG